MLRAGTSLDTEAAVDLACAIVTSTGEAVVFFDPADPDPPLEAVFGWVDERGANHIELQPADTARIAHLAAHGWTHARSVLDLTMCGPAPVGGPVWPDGVGLRRYVRGEDDAAVHQLVYVDAAFAAVPGHHDRDLATWQQMYTAENFSGWIAERGSGLGRALLLHSFTELLADGANGLGLTVQAANNRAIGLYRSVGLEVQKEWLVYARGSG